MITTIPEARAALLAIVRTAFPADGQARVVREDGTPIAGLYTAGNDHASIMRGHYPAGGINLGPALTFGYIAGRDLAGVTRYEDDGTEAPTPQVGHDHEH